MDIINELKSNQVLLLLMDSSEYNSRVLGVIKKISAHSVCYVTLNKTFESLTELFKKNKIDTKNILFIDAISKTFKKTPTQTKGCYFVDSPSALNDLSIQISKCLKHKFEYLIFDSLTNLLIYEKKAPLAKFVSTIVNKIRAGETKAILYALNINEQQTLIEESEMFVDKVINLRDKKTSQRS